MRGDYLRESLFVLGCVLSGMSLVTSKNIVDQFAASIVVDSETLRFNTVPVVTPDKCNSSSDKNFFNNFALSAYCGMHFLKRESQRFQADVFPRLRFQ